MDGETLLVGDTVAATVGETLGEGVTDGMTSTTPCRATPSPPTCQSLEMRSQKSLMDTP